MPPRARIVPVVLLATTMVGAALSRVDAAAPRIGPNGQGSLYVVGDSLTFGANYFDKMQSKIEAIGTWQRVVVDAKDGRKTTVGARLIADRIRSAPDTTALVVALGTNDMISHGESSWPDKAIDAVMRAAAGRPVLWMNLRFNTTPRPDWRSRGIRFNKALDRARTRWTNLTVADWSAWFTPSGKVRYISDGVHLTVSGYRVRSGWLVLQLRSFGAQIVNATTTTISAPTTAPPSSSTSTPPTSPPTTGTPSTTTATTLPGMGQS